MSNDPILVVRSFLASPPDWAAVRWDSTHADLIEAAIDLFRRLRLTRDLDR